MTNVIGEITEGTIAVIWGGGVWRPLPGVLHLRLDFTKLLSCGANRAIPYILIMLIEQLQMKILFQPKPILPFKIAPSSSSTHTHTHIFFQPCEKHVIFLIHFFADPPMEGNFARAPPGHTNCAIRLIALPTPLTTGHSSVQSSTAGSSEAGTTPGGHIPKWTVSQACPEYGGDKY